MTSVVGTTTAREDRIAPTLESLLPSWTRSLRAAGKSTNTVSGYLDGVRCFTDFLHELGLSQTVALITREHIEMFLERQLADHKPSTAATRFRSLRLFWRWCVEEGEVKASPMARMRPPAIPEAPVPVIAGEDLKKLLRVCEGAGFNARRDMAIVRLAVDTGLRRAELAGIGLEDLDLEGQVVRVVGKGRRVRTVPFGTKAAVAIDRYMRVRASHSGAGLEAQRGAIREECARRGWRLAELYEDAASGRAIAGRAGLKAALTALDSHVAGALVVAKLDRLSRSLLDFSALMEQSRRRGWALVALDLGVDTTTPSGEMMANVLAVFAQLERRLIGQRTREALAVKRQQGVRLGRPRVMSPDTVAEIRRLRSRGKSLAAIAGRLNLEARDTAHGGRRWYVSTASLCCGRTGRGPSSCAEFGGRRIATSPSRSWANAVTGRCVFAVGPTSHVGAMPQSRVSSASRIDASRIVERFHRNDTGAGPLSSVNQLSLPKSGGSTRPSRRVSAVPD